MRNILERLLQSVDVPSPERAEQLWAEYRANGDKADAAFATLLAWYGGSIYRRIWGFVRSDAAEDVFQDVLVRLHRRRHRFADFEHALRWLRGVAVTQSLNARRGDKRRTTREHVHAAIGGTAVCEPAVGELGEALRVALAKLPDREREAVALVYFEGMTRQDGATALGVHRDTIAKLLDTALGHLRSALAVTTIGTVATTATVEAALTVNPGLTPARLTGLTQAVWANARGPTFAWFFSQKVVALVLVGGLLTAAAGLVLLRSYVMPRPTSVPLARLQVERLEPREVPSADLVSALGIGNATSPSVALNVAADAVGNSYMTGYFSGVVDFDPAVTHLGDADVLTALGKTDAFVAKYAPDNSLVWARRMGGPADTNLPFNDTGRDIALDTAGNVYVGGSFEGTADFGSVTLTSAGSLDGYIAKFDPTGNVLWATRWGSTSTNYPSNLAVDVAGNVVAAGIESGGFEVRKYTATGGAVWDKRVYAGQVTVGGVAADAAGNVYVTGRFSGTADFNPGLGTKYVNGGSRFSGYVLKLTDAGNFGWVSPFLVQGSSSTAYCVPNGLAVDGGGNVVVGGSYSGSVDFNPGNGTTTLPGTYGGFITKLTNLGSLVWAKSFEGNEPVTLNGLAVDAAGAIYATGSFRGTVDFDPGTGTRTRTSAGGEDVFVVQLDAAGNFGWAESFGSTGFDIGYGVAVDPAGTVHLAGSYRLTVDFDPNPNVAFDLTTPGTFANIFLVRLRSN